MKIGMIEGSIPYCPYCETELDGYTSISGSMPRENDFSICLYCHNLIVFRIDQTLRKPTSKEKSEFKEAMKQYIELKEFYNIMSKL